MWSRHCMNILLLWYKAFYIKVEVFPLSWWEYLFAVFPQQKQAQDVDDLHPLYQFLRNLQPLLLIHRPARCSGLRDSFNQTTSHSFTTFIYYYLFIYILFLLLFHYLFIYYLLKKPNCVKIYFKYKCYLFITGKLHTH